MSNPLYQQLNQNPLSNVIRMMKNSNNPSGVMDMLAQQNPQVGQVLNMVQQSRMSPKELFYQQAQQMGVNPNDILNQLK